MNWIAYEKPETLSEALTLLEKAGGKGRLIAGGTDLVLQLQRGAYHADRLVDITGIPGLSKIEETDGWIRIGASVTHAEVAKHPLIRQEAKALSEGCGQMGSPQIRNSATLVGNIVSAQPAADGAIPLMALDAEIKVVSQGSERWLPLEAGLSRHRSVRGGCNQGDGDRNPVQEDGGRTGPPGFSGWQDERP